MNTAQAIKQLEKEYSHAAIVEGLAEFSQNEYVAAQLEPSVRHPSFSLQALVLNYQASHHHERSAEICIALKGSVQLTLEEENMNIEEGSFQIIPSGKKHSLSAQGAMVALYAEPGLTPDDTHYEAKQEQPKEISQPPSIDELVEALVQHHIKVQHKGSTLVLDIGHGKVFTLSIP